MNPLLQKRLFHVTANRPLGEGAFEVTFAPAEGEQMFPFKAGQWVYLYLLNEDGGEWARAAFSIASAPVGATDRFELAIKVYGDFTKRARTLKTGDVVRIQGPFGLFTMANTMNPLVIFAAGIGITPFLSMIREEISRGTDRKIVLFYTNKLRADISYEQELRDLAVAHPQLKVVFIITREKPEGWTGETRRLDAEMIRTDVQDLTSAEYLMCGPNEFMDAIHEMLASLGVDVKTRLRKERFS